MSNGEKKEEFKEIPINRIRSLENIRTRINMKDVADLMRAILKGDIKGRADLVY